MNFSGPGTISSPQLKYPITLQITQFFIGSWDCSALWIFRYHNDIAFALYSFLPITDVISELFDEYEDYDIYSEVTDTIANCTDCLLPESENSNSSTAAIVDLELNSTGAPTPTPGDDYDLRANQEETMIEPCETQLDLFTLFGGILIGVTLTILAQCCCVASRKKGPESYSVPYKFDEFVNP